MAIFQPARAKSSKVASCRLPLGIPSFKRFIVLPPERKLWWDRMSAPRRYGRCRFLQSAGRNNWNILRDKRRVLLARRARAVCRRRNRCVFPPRVAPKQKTRWGFGRQRADECVFCVIARCNSTGAACGRDDDSGAPGDALRPSFDESKLKQAGPLRQSGRRVKKQIHRACFLDAWED